MGAMLCYGDSNTWGYRPDGSGRFARKERWPGLVQAAVGDSVNVIEEGLSGRTSAYDHPLIPHMNGLSYLPVALATHAPLDAVVLFLGTNDLFLPGRFGADEAARGVAALVECVRASGCGPQGSQPAALVLVPPPFGPLGAFEIESPEGVEESARFSESFARFAQRDSFSMVDLRGVAVPSDLDGVHFEVASHRLIAAAVTKALGELVGWPAHAAD
jgi:lysophospholipase L1-like esterase